MSQSHGPAGPFHIRVDRTLTHPQVIALLEEHLAGMRAASPPECVFALDLNGLRRPDITFLTAWQLPADGSSTHEEGELVAMGALKELTPTTVAAGGHGKLKFMRTSARHLRQGAAKAILTELLRLARERGYARVSQEAETTPGFFAARTTQTPSAHELLPIWLNCLGGIRTTLLSTYQKSLRDPEAIRQGFALNQVSLSK